MESKITNIFIGYHERLIFEGLSALINSFRGYQVVGGISLERLSHGHNFNNQANILLILNNYPGKKTLEYIRLLKEHSEELPVLLVSSAIKNGLIKELVDSGIRGFLLRNSGEDDLLQALDKIKNGENYYSPAVTTLLLNEYKDSYHSQNTLLTPREKEILKLLVEGFSNAEAGKKLKISEATVKTHRKNIMKKLDTRNLISIIRYACRNNLVDFENTAFCQFCPYKKAEAQS